MTKLKKAAFMVVARCLSSEEIKGLRELFKTIDANNDGTITVDELKVGYPIHKQGSPNPHMFLYNSKLRPSGLLRKLIEAWKPEGRGFCRFQCQNRFWPGSCVEFIGCSVARQRMTS